MKRTPIKRGAPLRRKVGVKPVNPERRKAKFARNYGTRGAAVRELGCLVRSEYDSGHSRGHNCDGPIHAAHVIARGMGGVKGDRRDLVPLCAHHHHAAGERGTTQRADFEWFYAIDLQAEAGRIAEQLDREGHA